jgi:hypothetical protein
MGRECAADEAGGAGAGSVEIQPLFESGADGFRIGEAKVIVGREIQEVGAAYPDERGLWCLKGAQLPVQGGGVQGSEILIIAAHAGGGGGSSRE